MLEGKVFARVQVPPLTRDDLESFRDEARARTEALAVLAKGDFDETRWRQALAHIESVCRQFEIANEELRVQFEEIARGNRSLENERRRYFDLFERNPVPHFVTDRLGVIHEANPAATDLIGKPFDDIRAKPICVYLERDTVGSFRVALTEVAGGSAVEVTAKVTQREGPPRPMRFNGCLTSSPHRILWVAQEANESGMRFPRLGEAPVVVDAAVESRAGRERRAVIDAVMSELRAPLKEILEATARLRTVPDEAEREALLASIEALAMLQASAVEGLFDVACVTTQSLPLDMSPVDVGAVAHFAVSAVRDAAEARGVALAIEVEEQVTVHADEQRLAQMLLHLLSNALKNTKEGGSIRLQLRRKGPRCVLSVSDTGRGVAPERLPGLFECFSRREPGPAPPESGEDSGLGVGLFLVKRLAELHAGTVTAVSEGEGRGATFLLGLPVLRRATGPSSRRRA